MLVYEDNFGFLNISEPEEWKFFYFVRRQSLLTACERCERRVRLIPPKALCASCVSRSNMARWLRLKNMAVRKRFWIPLARREGRFFPSSAALCVATLSSK